MSPVGRRRLQVAQFGEVAALRIARVRQPPLQGRLLRLRAREQPAQGFNGCFLGLMATRTSAACAPAAQGRGGGFIQIFLPGNWPPPPPPFLPMPAVGTSDLVSETMVCIWSKA